MSEKIEIKLVEKVKNGNGEEIDMERIEKETISIDRPDSYKDLEQQIKSKFKLDENELNIKGFDSEDDEININNDDEYKDSGSKKFIVLIEGNSKKPDMDKFINDTLDLENDFVIDENEIINYIDETIKNLEEKNTNIELEESSMKEFNEEEKKVEEELYNYFLSDFNKKISEKTKNQYKTFIESVNNELFKFDEVIDNKVNSFKNNTEELLNESNLVHKDLSDMNTLIPKLSPLYRQDSKSLNNANPNGRNDNDKDNQPKIDNINPPNNEEKPKNNEQKPENNEEKPENNEEKPKNNEAKPENNEEKPENNEEKPKNNEDKPKNNEEKPENNEEKPENNEEKPENKEIQPEIEKLDIKSKKDKFEIEEKDANNFSIEVIIKNISEKKINLKNKKWIKGKKSNENINFFNEKNEINNDEEIENEGEKTLKVQLAIKDPKQGEKYDFELTIENIDNNKEKLIIQNPIYFNVEILKKKEDNKPGALTQEKIDEIYAKLDEEYVVNNFMKEEDVKKKIVDMNGNMEKLIEWVEENI